LGPADNMCAAIDTGATDANVVSAALTVIGAVWSEDPQTPAASPSPAPYIASSPSPSERFAAFQARLTAALIPAPWLVRLPPPPAADAPVPLDQAYMNGLFQSHRRLRLSWLPSPTRLPPPPRRKVILPLMSLPFA
jgi:hypothetical protein